MRKTESDADSRTCRKPIETAAILGPLECEKKLFDRIFAECTAVGLLGVSSGVFGVKFGLKTVEIQSFSVWCGQGDPSEVSSYLCLSDF